MLWRYQCLKSIKDPPLYSMAWLNRERFVRPLVSLFLIVIDDGTVLLDDGSVIQQRQYSIFANLEDPPEPNVYARITNIDGLDGNLTLSLMYFAAVTDNHASVYDVNVVNQLPPSGYTGQSVLDKTNGKIHVWYDEQWNSV